MKTLSTSLQHLVKILNDGKFHSGNELGQSLKISRNAVWKHINQLEKYGVTIETMQSKGYRLVKPLILLESKIIRKNLVYSGKYPLNKIKILGSVSSTQDYIRTLPEKDFINTTVCLAEHQNCGRGRFGRHWISPFGKNIYMSCGWQVNKDVSKLNGLSLVVALAITKTLAYFNLSKEVSIKWPNDILVLGKKLAGILVEIRAESYGNAQVIIGIGINVNTTQKNQLKIDRAWTSLQQILGQYQDRNKIVGLLLGNLLQYLEDFDHYGLDYFMSDWIQYDYLLGKPIILHINNSEDVTGIVAGIDEQGHLLLDRQGQINAFSAGEASLSYR